MTDPRTTTLSSSRRRILDASLKLFIRHGVAGTSLQMIADEIGVTKAAVYHQFNTKAEIVIAVGTLILGPLEQAAERVAVQTSPSKRRQMLVDELIEQAVENRRVAAFLQHDPSILRLYDEHEPFRNMMTMFNELLIGDNNTREAKVTAALILTSIGGAVMHPLVADVDNDTLRKQLRIIMRTVLKQLNK